MGLFRAIAGLLQTIFSDSPPDIQVLLLGSDPNLCAGFPGLTPVTIRGVIRITNNSSPQSRNDAQITSVVLDLLGNCETSRKSTSSAKQVLLNNPITLIQYPMVLQSGRVVDLPFEWNLDQALSDSLPSSFEANKGQHTRDYAAFARYLIKCEVYHSASSTPISLKIPFRMLHFNIDMVKAMLATDDPRGWSDSNSKIEYHISFDKLCVAPGDALHVKFRCVPRGKVLIQSLAIRIKEYQTIYVPKNKLVFSGPVHHWPPRTDTKVWQKIASKEYCMNWEITEPVNGAFWQEQTATIQLPDVPSQTSPPNFGLNPSVNTPHVSIAHKIKVVITLQGASNVKLELPLQVCSAPLSLCQSLVAQYPQLLEFRRASPTPQPPESLLQPENKAHLENLRPSQSAGSSSEWPPEYDGDSKPSSSSDCKPRYDEKS
ncbi:uncharacterized protein BJ171DRAFT_494405 [Polychytrium aggregatum]|uniref:uncharacterized protein n=1 Tax=Polychytrium aggregatum TaxID=110093 RepID=UPI0022FE7544|nr:uncharacterized protein BJ171DRAFT_494405 [Polychytrium aggregatum]KAI9207362.1 hypothetical protein BJ171DRAFT_494405 [Polychytrium aggregatum]